MTRRRLPAWLAGLAFLTHLLSMSLPGMPSAEARQPSGAHGQAPVAAEQHAGHMAPSPAQPDHGGMGHAGMLQCCCGAGHVGLAALPFEPPRLPEQLARRIDSLPEVPPALPSPRQQWPALNPRASPLA
ncbi:hypothetical protein [Stutzerimonas azotifigens]|uniref:hypothetical protein n=1 Tax=Stutzerimonas azotifigens TaxID=291995 RepID=UPI0004055DCE|nr:hypothetical protein [Stutzerimonas azotifigens]